MNRPTTILIVLFVFSFLLFSVNADAQRGARARHADRNKDGTIDRKEWNMEKQWEHKQRTKKKADADGDGTVSATERYEWKEQVRERLDTDDDGTISSDERKAGRAVVNTAKEKAYDANDDGYLDEDEIEDMREANKAMIKSKGKAKVDTDTEETYDANDDGVINKEEAEVMKEALEE